MAVMARLWWRLSRQDDLDEVIGQAADALLDWLRCPCGPHEFWCGVAAGGAVGFGPALVLDSALDLLGADGTALPAGVDVLALNDLIRSWWPTDAGGAGGGDPGGSDG